MRRAATVDRRHWARLRNASRSHRRTDGGTTHVWWRGSLTRRSGTGLDGVLRQASPGHDTLLCAVHADAKSLSHVSDNLEAVLRRLTHPSSYSWSMRTSVPALSSSSSPIEGLKSSCTRWTLLGPAGAPLGRPAAMAPAAPAAVAAPTIIGVPIAGDEGTSSVHAGLAGALTKLALTPGGAGKSCSDMGTLGIAIATATASTSGAAAGEATVATVGVGARRASRSVLGAAEC